jgi:hypothetical protein
MNAVGSAQCKAHASCRYIGDTGGCRPWPVTCQRAACLLAILCHSTGRGKHAHPCIHIKPHTPVVPICYYACSARRALPRAVVVPLLLLPLCRVALAKAVLY